MIRTGKDYIELGTSAMKAVGAHVVSDPSSVPLGGLEFWKAGWASRDQEISFMTWFVTALRGYGLSFQLTAGSRDDLLRLEEIVQTLHFQ